MIYTGITALYKRGIIDYRSDKVYVSLKHGKESSKDLEQRLGYIDKRVDFETNTYGLFAEKYKDELIYSNERLFLEINKWDLSIELKDKAIKYLTFNTNPHLLVKVYDEVIKKRRGIEIPDEARQIIDNYENPVKKILEGDSHELINNYFLKSIEKMDINIVIKGGTAIQAYWDTNRKTLDIDAHALKEQISEMLNILSDKNNPIRFKAYHLEHINGIDIMGKEFSSKDINNKKVIKLIMVPITYGKENKLKEYKVKFSINTSISDINETIQEFGISKRKIGAFNANLMVFSKEMLIAEKYQTIISKPESTRRTKDLLDLYFLTKESFDFNIFKKWLIKKYKNQRDSVKTFEEIKQIVLTNKDKELKIIKGDWSSCNNTYNVNINYEDALNQYNLISNKVINE